MIVGVGVDVVDVARFVRMLERTPGAAERLFTAEERTGPDGRPRATESLAARFAAKEAAAKALGAPAGLRWTDCEVVAGPDGRPRLRVVGSVARVADALGVRSWHVSLSHDGGCAVAHVVAEGEAPGPRGRGAGGRLGDARPGQVRTGEGRRGGGRRGDGWLGEGPGGAA